VISTLTNHALCSSSVNLDPYDLFCYQFDTQKTKPRLKDNCSAVLHKQR